MANSKTELSQDVVYDILSSPRRRYVLYYLRTVDEPVEITELAKQVAAWENDTAVEDVTDQQHKRVYVSLYQTHIPRLESTQIVDYDKDTGKVALTVGETDIDDYLDHSEDQIPWQLIYLSLAVASALLVGLALSNIWIFSTVTMTTATVIMVVAFVVTAGIHTLRKRFNRGAIPTEQSRKF